MTGSYGLVSKFKGSKGLGIKDDLFGIFDICKSAIWY